MSAHTSTAMMSAPSSASRMACSRPWPRAAPVMNATLPATLPIVFVIVTSGEEGYRHVDEADLADRFHVSHRRIPRTPDACRRPAAFPAPGGERVRLHPRSARVDCEERRLPADVQEAPRQNARRHLERCL